MKFSSRKGNLWQYDCKTKPVLSPGILPTISSHQKYEQMVSVNVMALNKIGWLDCVPFSNFGWYKLKKIVFLIACYALICGVAS